MSVISDFASNSVMGVVRKIVNHITGNIDPTLRDAVDHLPSRFHGTFDDNTRNLQLTIESQGTSTEDLVATVNIPGGGGSGGPTYSAGNGITITPANAIEIDPDVTATVADVDTRVAKNQGTANAGKVLGIGSDGMVGPANIVSTRDITEIPIDIENLWITFDNISGITENISGNSEKVSTSSMINFTRKKFKITTIHDNVNSFIFYGSPTKLGTANTSFTIIPMIIATLNNEKTNFTSLTTNFTSIVGMKDDGSNITALGSMITLSFYGDKQPLIEYKKV